MAVGSVFARHPRYALSVAVGLLVTLLLLASQHDPVHAGPSYHQFDAYDTPIRTVGAKLKEAETIYQGVLEQRKALITKFGPKVDDIVNFPGNVPPWPPYTVWDFFPAAFQCPWEVERVGALGDGGKWTCGLSRVAHKKNCVVYSIGINHESSFEAGILSRTKDCQVWGYDYSVKEFGPEIQEVPSLLARSHFYPYYLSGVDAHGPTDDPQQWTLPSLMKANGHTFIDVLKIDIESWEFTTLADMVQQFTALLGGDSGSGLVLPFGQLQLEVHAWPDKKFPYFLKWWEMLEAAGLRPFWTEPNLVYANYNRDGAPELAEYSFINIRGDHELLNDTPRHLRE